MDSTPASHHQSRANNHIHKPSWEIVSCPSSSPSAPFTPPKASKLSANSPIFVPLQSARFLPESAEFSTALECLSIDTCIPTSYNNSLSHLEHGTEDDKAQQAQVDLKGVLPRSPSTRSASPSVCSTSSACSDSSDEFTLDEHSDSQGEPDSPEDHEQHHDSEQTNVKRDDPPSTNPKVCDNATIESVRPLTVEDKADNSSEGCDQLIIGPRHLHHISYFDTCVFEKTATPPAASLALIKTFAGKPAFDIYNLPRLVMVRNAMHHIDPIIYNGPQEHLYKLWGSKLQEAVTGHCTKAYQPVGSWMHDSYTPEEDVPVIDPELYLSTEVALNSIACHDFLDYAAYEWRDIEECEALLRPRKRKPWRNNRLKRPLPKSRLAQCWGPGEEDSPVEQEQPRSDWKDRLAALNSWNEPLGDWADEVVNEVLVDEVIRECPAQQESQLDWKAKLAALDEWEDPLEDWTDEVADEVVVEPRSHRLASTLKGQGDSRFKPWLTGPWRQVNK